MSDLLADDQLVQIRSLRRVAVAGGIFAAATSLAANVYASDGTAVGWAVGATAPAAFIFAENLSTRSLVGNRSRLSLTRTIIASTVVVGAGIVSFSHLSEVVRSVGESGMAALILPLLVDAVVLCGILTMHDTAAQLRKHTSALAAKQDAERAAEVEVQALADREAGEIRRRAELKVEQATARSSGKAESAPTPRRQTSGSDGDIASEVRRLAAERPDLTQAEIGELVGRSVRTVRRYLSDTDNPTPEQDADTGLALVLGGGS